MAELQLRYTREELLANHEYAELNVINGRRLHGGFDEQGVYQPPRSLVRSQAVKNWTRALRERGWDLLDADSSLLKGARLPNAEQQRLLIRAGMSRIFWNGLTIIGKIEARGRMLAQMPLPNLQDFIVEDITDMAIGHLGEGLMYAHGIDEGGEPENGIGGHDVMWFVARDLSLGEDAWPDVEPPGRIGRQEPPSRRMPALPEHIEALLVFLMNLLMIEFRAEIGFAATQETLRTEGLFESRADKAELAAEIVEKIRTDERIHVESLRLYLGEFRSLHFRTVDGGEELGATFIDPFWYGLVQWATGEQPKLVAQQTYENIASQIRERSDHEQLLGEFDRLMDENVF